MPSRLSQPLLRQTLRQPSEKELRRDLVRLLEKQLHYTVMQTGQVLQKTECPNCHTFFFPSIGTSNSVGCPDIYVAHSDSGNIWRAIELKAPGMDSLFGRLQEGAIRPEQKKLVELGVSSVITTVDGALELVRELRK